MKPRIFGIEIELHLSFILLFFILVLSLALFFPENFFNSIILFFLLFLSVFFHELSHSIIALSKGIKVKKIILLPIGGVSVSESLIEKPEDELLIAIAGPLFNFAVVFFLLLIVLLFRIPFPYNLISTAKGLEEAIMNYPLFALLWINLILGLFNLFVPALPMDGGRVLRALLSIKLGELKATRIASKLSLLISIIFFVLGFLIQNILLLLIAVFVFIGAKQEEAIVIRKTEAKKIELHDLINFNPLIIDNESTLLDAFNAMRLKGKETALIKDKHYFFVSLEMLSVIPKNQWNKKVKEIAKKVPEIGLNKQTSNLVDLIFLKGFPVIAVKKENELIGVIERETFEKAIEFQRIIEGQ